jgi:uncharacterized phosphosugar-binding protein
LKVAEKYLDALREALGRIEPEQIQRAASLIADSLGSGGIIHTFGTGHSSLLAQEVFYRAGGLVAIHPLLDSRLGFEWGVIEGTEFERSLEAAEELAAQAGFRSGDAGIVISNSGRNALPVEMALRMKAAGMNVIALTNLEQSRMSVTRHPSGKRLFEVVDEVLDNHCPAGDAALRVPGIAEPLGPLSTVVGAAILHAVFVEAAALLASQGKSPATFVSANLPGTSIEDLRRLLAPYQGRIRYYRPGGGREQQGG